MGKHQSSDIAKGNLINPSHHPMPGVDDAVIDAGATSGAQLPSKETEKEAGKLQKDNSGSDRSKGVDPDVLSK